MYAKRLTVVTSYFPYPEDSGDPVRVNDVLASLSSLRSVRLLTIKRPSTSPEHVADLSAKFPGMEIEAFDAEARGLTRLILAFRRGWPIWVASRFSQEMQDRVEQLSRTEDAFLVVGEAAAAYMSSTNKPWHWDKANVITESSITEVADAPRAMIRLKALLNVHLSRIYERRLVPKSTSITVTSPEDGNRLTRRLNRSADGVVVSSVKLPHISSTERDYRQVVWLGSADYVPNSAGLSRFLREGWPLLARNGYKFTVVGSGQLDDIRRKVGDIEGVEWRGYVPDLSTVMEGAGFGVVPLWSGAGVKLKTLTLMSWGLAVAGTDAAFEGIPVSGTAILANDPKALAGAILATKEERAAEVGAAARGLVEEMFSQDAFGPRFWPHIENLLVRDGQR